MLYQSYFPPTNFDGYSPIGYQMTVPPQTFWQGQTNSNWSTNIQSQKLLSSVNNTQTQISLAGSTIDSSASNVIKKQNNNNLIDLNFFDSIENPKEKFSNVRTSVLEAFDPLLHELSNVNSSAEIDQGIYISIY